MRTGENCHGKTANPSASTTWCQPGKSFALAKRDPRDDERPCRQGGGQGRRLAEDAAAIDALQDRLFAEGKRALLVVLQGIDCSGKDGTVRAVFNTCGPIGVRVAPFKAPTADELAQDYLWRVHKACPPKGYIGIFNRSHYEDVLVVKVKGYASPEAIERRYDEINAFEKMLTRQRHEDPEVHAAHLEGGAGRAPARAHRDAREALEVQPRRPRGPRSCGTTTWRPMRRRSPAAPPRMRRGT